MTVETDATIYRAERAVVAVPGPLVSELGFAPPLPVAKTRALRARHYGTATKAVVQYAEREAVHQAVGSGCLTDGLSPWLVAQSLHQDGDAAVVATLLGGHDEPGVVTEDTLARCDAAVTALVGQPVRRLYAASHSWTRDVFSRVIVCAPLGGQRRRLLPAIQAPLGDVVYFAGEHTDDRAGPGGLEGAVRSARRVLGEIAASTMSR